MISAPGMLGSRSFTGQPGTAAPLPSNAYTCWSIAVATISSAGPPVRSASTGAAKKPRLTWFSRVRSCGREKSGFRRTGKPATGAPSSSQA